MTARHPAQSQLPTRRTAPTHAARSVRPPDRAGPNHRDLLRHQARVCTSRNRWTSRRKRTPDRTPPRSARSGDRRFPRGSGDRLSTPTRSRSPLESTTPAHVLIPLTPLVRQHARLPHSAGWQTARSEGASAEARAPTTTSGGCTAAPTWNETGRSNHPRFVATRLQTPPTGPGAPESDTLTRPRQRQPRPRQRQHRPSRPWGAASRRLGTKPGGRTTRVSSQLGFGTRSTDRRRVDARRSRGSVRSG